MGLINYTTTRINELLALAATALQSVPNLDASKITSGTFADARIASASTWNNKQDALVSGTNIKTINSNSILGSGNLDIDGLPSQSGQSGKFLTTDGSTASWGSVPASVSVVTYTATVGTTWTKDSTANWYTQSVSVSGILATDTPDADVDLSSLTTSEDVESALSAWGNIFKIVTSANSITVYSAQATTTSISVTLRCIR